MLNLLFMLILIVYNYLLS